MDTVKFSLDIFHLVLDISDRRVVSSLMRTCRALNHEGVTHILAKDPEIRSKNAAQSFGRFLAARNDPVEIAHRFERLHGLSISLPEFESEAMIVAPLIKKLLTEGASRMKNFIRLNISGLYDLVLADPELPSAIVALTTLRSLTLSGIEPPDLEGLSGLKSRLTRATISIHAELSDDAGYDFPGLLQNSMTTLRFVSFQYVNEPVSSPTPPAFLNVRDLSLEYVETVVTRNLVAAFPNLERLAASWAVLTTIHQVGDEVLNGHRARNIAAQQEHGTWHSLRRFSGSLAMLYLLGLTCHVPIVRVGVDENEGFDLKWARAVVADTQPTHLTFDIGYPTWNAEHESFIEDITALFSHRAFQNVKVLRINLDLFPGDSDLDLASVLDAIFHAITLCSAEAVAVTISGSECLGMRFPKRRVSEPPGVAEVYMRSFDARTLADRLAEMAPFLRTVIISRDPWSRRTNATAQRGPDIPGEDASDSDSDGDA